MSAKHQKSKAEISKQSSAGPIRLFSALNPKYTFDTFVVWTSNQFAYSAARTVADNLADTYNPLLIYGSYGLNKTHSDLHRTLKKKLEITTTYAYKLSMLD